MKTRFRKSYSSILSVVIVGVVITICTACGEKEAEQKMMVSTIGTGYINNTASNKVFLSNEAKNQEKIELVRSVYERNCDMVNEFLRDFPGKMKTIDVYSYDFTGDNQPEIILTKRYVDDHTDEVIT